MIVFPTIGWIHDAQERDGKPSESRQRQSTLRSSNYVLAHRLQHQHCSIHSSEPRGHQSSSSGAGALSLPPQPSIESRAVRCKSRAACTIASGGTREGPKRTPRTKTLVGCLMRVAGHLDGWYLLAGTVSLVSSDASSGAAAAVSPSLPTSTTATSPASVLRRSAFIPLWLVFRIGTLQGKGLVIALARTNVITVYFAEGWRHPGVTIIVA